MTRLSFTRRKVRLPLDLGFAAVFSDSCTWKLFRNDASRIRHGHHRDLPERRLRNRNDPGRDVLIDNPAHLPDPSLIDEIREPIVKAYVLCPNESIGDILQLIMEKRGQMDHTETLDTRRVMLHCELPLNEILVDFDDKIKSMTRGYGSMDYEHAGYRQRNW